MDRPTRLSPRFVKTIARPGRYGDGRGGFGLSLLVRPVKDGLRKNWQQRVQVNGEARSLGLGSYPDVSLSRARHLAAENVVRIRELCTRPTGIDRLLKEVDLPVVTSDSTGPTFADVAEEFIDFRRTSWKAGSKTEKQTRSLLAGYVIPAIGDVPIEQVTPAQAVDVLTPIWHLKVESARKVKRNMQAIFNFARSKGYTDVHGIDWALDGLGPQRKVVEHHAAVHYSDIGQVLEYVRSAESYESKRMALEFLILTAARTIEVRGARWAEIDFDKTTWTIPADRMKNGREHSVPLSTTALALLRRAREESYLGWRFFPDGLVFPDRSGREMISQDGLRQLLRRRFRATTHGFRSTFRDWAAEKTEFPAEIAEHALAHLEGSATIRAYRRTNYIDKRRELMQMWADFVTG